LFQGSIGTAAADGHLALFPCLGFLDQFRNRLQLAGSHHEINKGGPPKNQLLVFLGHAAEDTENLLRIFFLEFSQGSQGTVDLVFSLFPHAAGVEQDRVSIAQLVGQFVAPFAQAGNHHFAVQHVHLAADCLDVKSSTHLRQQPNALDGSIPGRLVL